MDEPGAMTLATTDSDGFPSSRIVLLKKVDEQGFVFYTNLKSRKAKELGSNPKVSLTFYWPETSKQVRIRGIVEPVSNEEADAYFASRPRESQLGAWASLQSSVIENKLDLEKRLAKFVTKFGLGTVPRPDFWSGYRVVPSSMEFWVKKPFRIHERTYFEKQDGNTWTDSRLYP